MGNVSSVEDSAVKAYGTEAGKTSAADQKAGNYGKTIGKPQLSEKAAKYYEELKKKFSNMDFILVSADQKAAAKAQAGSFANAYKTVVLIDEDKIEKMAEDEAYRAQYEGIIRKGASGLKQLKKTFDSNQNVKGYGMQINDNGAASFFAVVDKSMAAQRAAQRERIEKKAAQKKEDAKKDAKKTEKEKREEALEERRRTRKAQEDEEIVWASSIEELQDKVDQAVYSSWSDLVRTDEERQWGRFIDFKL